MYGAEEEGVSGDLSSPLMTEIEVPEENDLPPRASSFLVFHVCSVWMPVRCSFSLILIFEERECVHTCHEG